jgi:hypothetical protein
MDQGHVTVYHGGHMLELARRAYERSQKAGTEAEVSIILSAVAVEAFLNEIADLASSHADTPQIIDLADLLLETEKANIQPLFKLRLAFMALTGRLPSRGDALMQNVAALMSLRNALVHLKPQRVQRPAEDEAAGAHPQDFPKPILHLTNPKVIRLPEKRPYSWRQLVSTPEVARWAYNVAVRAMLDLAVAIPAGEFKEVVHFWVSGLNELLPSRLPAPRS